jgi:mannitol/fructose-specific phosphotransferase system IIA component (Ntr-type)
MPVNPANIISVDRIIDLKSTKKSDVLEELIDVLATSPLVTDRKELREKIFERERTLSTGVGVGMAIPHVKIPSIKDFVVAIGRTRSGINFESLDNQPTHIVVMIGCNNAQAGDFLKVLAQFVKSLKDPALQKSILDAPGPEQIRDLFIRSNSIIG